MDSTAPNPDRFKEYIEAEDGSGFYLDDGKLFFPFDELGGWYDEHGNYYNGDGQPSAPPKGLKGQNKRNEEDIADNLSDDDDDEGSRNYSVDEEEIKKRVADDELIDEYEEGAMLDDEDVEEVEGEEVDDIDETQFSLESELIGLKLKIKRLIREGATSLSLLIIDKGYDLDLEEEVKNLKVDLKKCEKKMNGLHVELSKDNVIHFLDKAFTPDEYDKYTVHLEEDEDDALPDNDVVAQNIKQQVKQAGKAARKPLQVQSQAFAPETDKSGGGENQTVSNAGQEKKAESTIKPADVKPEAGNESKKTGGRKPLL